VFATAPSITTAGRTASRVAAVRPNTYAPRAIETPNANHQWLGFGISMKDQKVLPEVALT
jgi:hypothetical protein